MQKQAIRGTIIQQVYNSYQSQYGLNLPKIRDIRYVDSDGFWAQFKSEDLYNKKYILYIDNELFEKHNNFVKQVLYHEFTHLVDSLGFLDKTYDVFKNIMVSYSEFHASKQEMLERIRQCDEPISLQTNVIHAGTLTIESLMSQTFNLMLNNLTKMKSNNGIENFFYDVKHIYYFYGYVSALQEFDLTYKVEIYRIPPEFYLQITEIQEILFEEILDYDKIISSYSKLEKTIIQQTLINKLLGNKRQSKPS